MDRAVRRAPTSAATQPSRTCSATTSASNGASYTEEQKLYWFFLVVLIVFAVLARNLVRSRIGRAFAAVRDRDIAAGVMGVNLTKYKLVAFTISSFYAGRGGLAALRRPTGTSALSSSTC